MSRLLRVIVWFPCRYCSRLTADQYTACCEDCRSAVYSRYSTVLP